MGKGNHLGEFEEIVLLAAARSEGHGAAIHAEILEATGRDVSIPAVYVTLTRLQKKGLVSTRVDHAGLERGGRPRKIFSPSADGIRALQAARVVHARLWDGLDFDPLRAGEES